MSQQIVHVSDSSFEQDVLKSNVPVLLDFWAEWCGPCKMIAPMLDQIATEYAGKVVIAKMNVDAYFDKPIDAQSDYTAPDGQVLRLRGPRDLADHAVTSADARRGFVRQLFQQTVKQAPVAYGADTLPELDAGFVESGYHIRKLLVDVAVTAATHGVTNQPATRVATKQ